MMKKRLKITSIILVAVMLMMSTQTMFVSARADEVSKVTSKIDSSKLITPKAGESLSDSKFKPGFALSGCLLSDIKMTCLSGRDYENDAIDLDNSFLQYVPLKEDGSVDTSVSTFNDGAKYGLSVCLTLKFDGYNAPAPRGDFSVNGSGYFVKFNENAQFEVDGYSPKIIKIDQETISLLATVELGTVSGGGEADPLPTFSYDSTKEASNFLTAGLIDNKTDLFTKVLTQEEQDSVKDGTNASVWLESKDVTSSVTAEDKGLVEKALPSDFKLSKYTDLNLYKKIGDAEAEKVSACPGGKVKVALDIPSDIKDKNYKIIRVHEGKAEVIDATAQGGKITFETDMFSTYAIAYGEKTGVKTGDMVNVRMILVSLIAVIGIGAIVYTRKKRY